MTKEKCGSKQKCRWKSPKQNGEKRFYQLRHGAKMKQALKEHIATSFN